MITNHINFEELLNAAQRRCSPNYFYYAKRYHYCFTGNYEQDLQQANQIIDSIVNHNTAHGVCSMFRWCYDYFYGMQFNHKHLHNRSCAIAKFTSRLDLEQIRLIYRKFNEWIYNANLMCNNNGVIHLTKLSRTRVLHVFNILVSTGMRAGEFTAIDFNNVKINRTVESKLSGEVCVEITINTEKTKKNREVFIPKASYEFIKKYGSISYGTLAYDFRVFREWAKLPFTLSPHTCRRTLATLMHESGVDVDTIAMVLGNTSRVVTTYYILSSIRNYDACDIARSLIRGNILKFSNMFLNRNFIQIKKEDINFSDISSDHLFYDH